MPERRKFKCPKSTINFIARNREKIKTFPKRIAPVSKYFILNGLNSPTVNSVLVKHTDKSNRVELKELRSPKLVVSHSKNDSPIVKKAEKLLLDQFFDCMSTNSSLCHLADKAVRPDKSDVRQNSTIKSAIFSNYYNFKNKCDQVQFEHANSVNSSEFKNSEEFLSIGKPEHDVLSESDLTQNSYYTRSFPAFFTSEHQKINESVKYRESCTSCSALDFCHCHTQTDTVSPEKLSHKQEVIKSTLDGFGHYATEIHFDSSVCGKTKWNSNALGTKKPRLHTKIFPEDLKKSISSDLDICQTHQLTQTDASLFEMVNKKVRMKCADASTKELSEEESSASFASKSAEMLFLK